VKVFRFVDWYVMVPAGPELAGPNPDFRRQESDFDYGISKSFVIWKIWNIYRFRYVKDRCLCGGWKQNPRLVNKFLLVWSELGVKNVPIVELINNGHSYSINPLSKKNKFEK